jgi:hypothetical protein
VTIRRRNKQQQLEDRIKTAASALLDVMRLLKQGVKLSEEGRQYFDACRRRIEYAAEARQETAKK